MPGMSSHCAYVYMPTKACMASMLVKITSKLPTVIDRTGALGKFLREHSIYGDQKPLPTRRWCSQRQKMKHIDAEKEVFVGLSHPWTEGAPTPWDTHHFALLFRWQHLTAKPARPDEWLVLGFHFYTHMASSQCCVSTVRSPKNPSFAAIAWWFLLMLS